MGTGKRLLGKYFRVAFFGQVTGPLKYDFNFFFQDFVPMQLKLICCRYRHVDHVLFVDRSVHDFFFFVNLSFLPLSVFSDVRWRRREGVYLQRTKDHWLSGDFAQTRSDVLQKTWQREKCQAHHGVCQGGSHTFDFAIYIVPLSFLSCLQALSVINDM